MSKNVLANSFIATGQAQAFSRGMSPERMAERSAAYAHKEASDQKLEQLQKTKPTDTDYKLMAEEQTAELINALEVQKQMMRDGNKRITFGGFERYDADSDIRHLNTMITDLSGRDSKVFGNIARVDELTEQDRTMLENELGLTASQVTTLLNNPKLKHSYVRITQTDGTVSFGDLDSLKFMSGYTDYADKKEVERWKTSRELEQLMLLGFTPDELGLEAFRRIKGENPDLDPKSPEFHKLYSEAYDKLVREKKARSGNVNVSGGKGENKTEKEAQAHRLTSAQAREEGFEEGSPEWDAAFSKHMNDIESAWDRPSRIRYDEAVQGAEDVLLDLGLMEFTAEELTNLEPRDRVQIEREIRKIENLGNASLSETDKKHLLNIRKLAGMGELAGELTDSQTGIIDNMLRTAKKYIFNDVEGIEAESAYSAFRNLVKHALYGASLQPGESANFLKQFGSLTQQRGPVLQQLRTTMEELKHAYEGIAATNNDMVIKWRTGQTSEELYRILEELDDRIEFIHNVENDLPITTINPPVETKKKAVLTPEVEAGLDKIFKSEIN